MTFVDTTRRTTNTSWGTASTALLLLLVLLSSLLAPPPAARAADDCADSVTETVRGKQVTLDQCVRVTRTIDGTEYAVLVYYRETALAANTAQCDATDGAGRCEHELPDDDDANGDNVVAVAVADESMDALEFYVDSDLTPIPADQDTMVVLIAEDPRSGGVIWPDTTYLDDEVVAGGFSATSLLLSQRLLAEHETMHLVQDQFNGTIGWQGFYGEGIARAIEDRIDGDLDATLGGLFMGEANGVLGTDGDRTSTLESNSYESVLFWTHLFDRFASPGDVEPRIGWSSIKDFYDELSTATTQLQATNDYVAANGTTFHEAFTAYAQTLWAYRFDPPSPLGFTDAELTANGDQLSGHPVVDPTPPYPSSANYAINPRSVNVVEHVDPGCDFVRFDVDGNGTTFTWSIMTADAGTLTGGWESTGTSWSRTVRATDVDRIALLTVGRESGGSVDVTSGCVEPTVDITSPTTAAFATVGTADAPRTFLVRLLVRADGSPVGGLLPEDFTASVTPAGSTTDIGADVVTAAQVDDAYWLLVQAPDAGSGAVTGAFHDLTVSLGTADDTEDQSLLYVERSIDSVVVLDRSGSMADDGRIEAAQNAANLFTNLLADEDQGGYVAFDTDAELREPLAPAGTGGHRGEIVDAIDGETPGGQTSIGDGMDRAADTHDDERDPEHACSFVLLSDGHENEDAFWADVEDQVVDNGCAIHAVALGPEANEPLLQEVAASVPGGSYDYAPTTGDVGVGGSTAGGATGGGGGGGATPGAVSWENNLADVYDMAASRSAGRQRILASDSDAVDTGDACGETGYGTDYTTLDPVQSGYDVGDGFASDDVDHEVLDYQFVNGERTDRGTLQHVTDSDDPYLFVGNVRVQPALPGGACRVEVFVRDLGGSANLTVNGDDVAVEDLDELDGNDVGGAVVSVDGTTTDGGATVVVEGAIQQFAIGGQELVIDDLFVQRAAPGELAWFIDPADDELVATFSWQQDGPGAEVTLRDPDGNAVPTSRRRVGDNGRNQVWTVPSPQPGRWTAELGAVPGEVLVTAQVDSLLELHAWAGTASSVGGGEVPVIATLTRPGGVVTGADVEATVASPDGRRQVVALVDDGGHGDGAPDDGVYGGTFRAVGGDVPAPPAPAEGEEPSSVGSHLVDVVATTGDVRRETQATFALAAAPDTDGDGVPDPVEDRDPDLDPTDPADGGQDPDGDDVPTRCELTLGTDPHDPDSDDGGDDDGTELGRPDDDCNPTQDPSRPLDASDDVLDPVVFVTATPVADADGPEVVVTWDEGQPDGTVFDVTRRCDGRPDRTWTGLGTTVLDDGDVRDGDRCRWVLRPRTPDGRTGPPVTSTTVEVRDDPYAPGGAVLIDGGAATTTGPTVDLEITADDLSATDDHVAPEGPPAPGDPVGDLEMRIGLDPASLQAAPWQPYRRLVDDVAIGDVGPDGVVTVRVELRDTSGNVSSALMDTILLDRAGLGGTTRLGGADRIATATTIAADAFADGEAEVAVLSRADVAADALAGTPLAVRRGGPLLLTGRDALAPDVATELQRVLPSGRTVFLLGGGAALGSGVQDAVEALGYDVERLAGPTRYETSVAVANRLGDVDDVLVARGDDFPDALSAGAAAGHVAGAVVLTPADVPHPATDAYLTTRPDARHHAVGGPAARAYPALTALSGADRFATATAVAEEFFDGPAAVGVARGDTFADALGGGVHAALAGGPVVLTPTGTLAPATEQYLCATPSIRTAYVYGGSAAVSDEVAARVDQRVAGDGC